jgi:hypothetical protein
VYAERSEAPVSSPIQRACHAAEGEREKQRGGAGSAAGPRGRNGSKRRYRRWHSALVMEVGWRTGEGGGAHATRRGATDRWDQAATGPGVSGGVREGEG